MDEEFQFRRLPSKDKNIKDISPENDIRIRILGQVIGKDNTLTVDDGTAKAEIIAEQEQMDKVNVGDTVRIFARVMPLEDGYELQGEIVQKMNDLNIDLYNKLYKRGV